MQERSNEDLAKARSRIVEEIQRLNNQVGDAKLSRYKKERRELERQRGGKYQELAAIDAEFNRRGLEPRNA